MIKLKVMEFINGRMGDLLKETGEIIKCTDKELSNGQIIEFIKANT